jgi:signal transduction histidine kinase
VTRLDRWRLEAHCHPRLVDVAAAVVPFVGTLLQLVMHRDGPQPSVWIVPLALVGSGALLVRRTRPWTALAVNVATAAVYQASTASRGPLLLSTIVMLFTIAKDTDRRTSLRIGLLTTVIVTGAGLVFQQGGWWEGPKWAVVGWLGLAAAMGDSVRTRQAYISAIEERAERAERTREEEARRRVTEERLRIARELHDVVAHHIALVSVEAGVASHLMDANPVDAHRALGHIRDASRSALEELRITVGLLRAPDESGAPTEPTPGLERIDALAASFCQAGLPVKVVVEGTARAVSGAVGLTVYRVVQEALTNTSKHAGPASAEVRIAYLPRQLLVSVEDDGVRAGAPGARPGTGHGILGMRERAASLQGTVETGFRPGGGFRVRLDLPLPTEGTDGR